jgi:hypothetical protein
MDWGRRLSMKLQRCLTILLLVFIVCYLCALGMFIQPSQLDAYIPTPQEMHDMPPTPTAF